MKSSEQKSASFSIKRFGMMISQYIHIHRGGWMLGLLVIIGIALVVRLIAYTLIPDSPGQISGNGWMGIYFIAGLLITSHIFFDVHKGQQSWLTLSLPASPVEKYWSAWALTGPIYTIGAMLLLFVLLLVFSSLDKIVTGNSVFFFNPFEAGNLTYIYYYLLLHSFFFWGAIYWNKMQFLSTLMFAVVISIGFAALTYGGVQLSELLIPDGYFIDLSSPALSQTLNVLKNLFWLLSWLFFLFWGYDRYKNAQVLS